LLSKKREHAFGKNKGGGGVSIYRAGNGISKGVSRRGKDRNHFRGRKAGLQGGGDETQGSKGRRGRLPKRTSLLSGKSLHCCGGAEKRGFLKRNDSRGIHRGGKLIVLVQRNGTFLGGRQ